MSTHGLSRRSLRRGAVEDDSSRRKIVSNVNVDGNMNPGTSHVVARRQRSRGSAASAIPQSNQSLGVLALATPLDATIDVEAIDDDVGMLSARVFPQVINQPRRNHPVIIDLDDDLDDQVGSSGVTPDEPEIQVALNNSNRLRQPISVNPEAYGNYRNVDGSHKSKRKRTRDSPEPQMAPKKEPAFACAICLQRMTEETSTNCGHIFCHGCIKTAIQTQRRCPTCRKRLTMKSIHRVYLPTEYCPVN